LLRASAHRCVCQQRKENPVLTTNHLMKALADERVAELRAHAEARRHAPKVTRPRISLPRRRRFRRLIVASAAVEKP